MFSILLVIVSTFLGLLTPCYHSLCVGVHHVLHPPCDWQHVPGLAHSLLPRPLLWSTSCSPFNVSWSASPSAYDLHARLNVALQISPGKTQSPETVVHQPAMTVMNCPQNLGLNAPFWHLTYDVFLHFTFNISRLLPCLMPPCHDGQKFSNPIE
jgi:hypothetical protein